VTEQDGRAKPTQTKRGWKAQSLPVVGYDPELWTAAEAAQLLGPPTLTTDQVRQLVRMLGMTAVGKRKTGTGNTGGRHARVYPAEALIRAFEALYIRED
jgi:hypothetical protein